MKNYFVPNPFLLELSLGKFLREKQKFYKLNNRQQILVKQYEISKFLEDLGFDIDNSNFKELLELELKNN